MITGTIAIKEAIRDNNLMEMINLLKGVGKRDEYSFGREYYGTMSGVSRREILQNLTGPLLNGDVLKKQFALKT